MEMNPYNELAHVTATLSDRLFDEEEIYRFLEEFLARSGMTQSLRLLPYVKEMHAGQLRTGKDHVPYYSHPLLVANHAVALGFLEDDLISAALLHDVCEDCNVLPEELPASEETKKAVSLLTKQPLLKPDSRAGEEEWIRYYREKHLLNQTYYSALQTSRIASIVKLLDRCNNISSMSTAWKAPKLAHYIQETEDFVLPLLHFIERTCPQYQNQCFLIRYHMKSVIETVRHLIVPETV